MMRTTTPATRPAPLFSCDWGPRHGNAPAGLHCGPCASFWHLRRGARYSDTRPARCLDCGAPALPPDMEAPDAAEDSARKAETRATRAALGRAIREGRALPAAGDLFGEPSPLTATPPPEPLDLFGGSE